MSKHGNFFLENIPLDEAWSRFISALENVGKWNELPGEELPIEEALGRITAQPVWAALSSPAYHASAMDGYAVRSVDTIGAMETAPKRLAITPGGPASYVDTGDPIPAWADAVIMIEHTQHIDEEDGGESIEIHAGVAPWTAIRPMGEDMVATELVLPANHLLKPVDLGALAGCGHATVSVRRRPRVAIIPTGTELVTVEQAALSGLKSGDIIEYNSLVLASQVREWGGIPTRYPIVVDDYELIKSKVFEAAAEHDLVLVNAGSSAGSEDFTSSVVVELGTLLVHGVAVRPGHPVILGMLAGFNTPVIGIPGYPVSCALTGETFVEPLLSQWLGLPRREKPRVQATISRKLLSPIGEDEMVRVTVGRVGQRIVAAPLSRGAGVITSLVRADGIVRIPRFSEGVEAGQEVAVELYRDPSDIERTLVHIGSHDLCLDLLAQFLADAGRRFTSANAGSLGGLMALRRGDAHLAGAHLLDPATGDYNVSYVKQYLPDLPVVLLTFMHREQGLIVAPGNPKGIRDLSDLARDDVRFVNRQRGAGTRVLLDYHLEKLGIKPEKVQGYKREEFTHLAVAVAIQSGVVDCGLGIAAAARALNLDFIPVEKERYDLVIPRTHYESDLLRPLLGLIHGPNLRRAISGLPGYDTTSMGDVVFEG
ncbi:MAG: molybdopterin biosynthesis protein [Desulfuromonadales bacterium]|nr:molybdopterin biosynthesis protein [Desulfuromonadales bacterium]